MRTPRAYSSRHSTSCASRTSPRRSKSISKRMTTDERVEGIPGPTSYYCTTLLRYYSSLHTTQFTVRQLSLTNSSIKRARISSVTVNPAIIVRSRHGLLYTRRQSRRRYSGRPINQTETPSFVIPIDTRGTQVRVEVDLTAAHTRGRQAEGRAGARARGEKTFWRKWFIRE